MLPLLGGLAVLCGLLLLGYLFVNANPARLANLVKWIGIAVVAALAIGLVVLTEGRVLVFLAPLAAAVPLLRRLFARFAGAGGPAAGGSSRVETVFLRMTLDHDTGAMTGTVLQGRFAGRRLDELARDELLALLRECRASDEEAARLVEAYLDRTEPDWREAFRGDSGGAPPRGGNSDMTVDEAYAVLGLAPGADDAAIRTAHHRLMKRLHPDHGGTNYFAAKLNRARDVLLGHRQFRH